MLKGKLEALIDALRRLRVLRRLNVAEFNITSAQRESDAGFVDLFARMRRVEARVLVAYAPCGRCGTVVDTAHKSVSRMSRADAPIGATAIVCLWCRSEARRLGYKEVTATQSTGAERAERKEHTR